MSDQEQETTTETEPAAAAAGTIYTCDQCGTRYGGPGVCQNGHEPADVIPLADAVAAGEKAQAEAAAAAPDPANGTEEAPPEDQTPAPPPDPDAPQAPPPLDAGQQAELAQNDPGAAAAGPSIASQVGAIISDVNDGLARIAALVEKV